MSDLKPCPFCGGSMYIDDSSVTPGGVGFWVPTCTDCGVSGPDTASIEEATNACNTRPREITWHPVSEEPESKKVLLANNRYSLFTDMVMAYNPSGTHWRVASPILGVFDYMSWEEMVTKQKVNRWTDRIPGP